MARGQERTIRGGEPSPYVQQALGRGRELAENRLVAAMSQAGEAQRQQKQQATQVGMQGAQLGVEAYQAAAQRQSQEKMAAQAEEGRRLDRLSRETLEKQRMVLEAAAEKARISQREKEFEATLKDKDKDRAVEQAGIAANLILAGRANASEYNAMSSLHSTLGGKEVTDQKAITDATQKVRETQQNISVFSTTRDRVEKELVTDPLMEKSPRGEFRQAPTRGLYEFGLHYKTEEVPDTKAAPKDLLQKKLKENGSKIELQDIVSPEAIESLKRKISEGKIDAQDIAAARGVIDGFVPTIEKKIDDASDKPWPEKPKYSDKHYWKDFSRELTSAHGNLTRLLFDKTKINGSETYTVGTVVAIGLGDIDQVSIGSRMNEMLNQGMNYQQITQSFRQSLDPFKPYDIPPGASPELIRNLELMNSIQDEGRKQAEQMSTTKPAGQPSPEPTPIGHSWGGT